MQQLPPNISPVHGPRKLKLRRTRTKPHMVTYHPLPGATTLSPRPPPPHTYSHFMDNYSIAQAATPIPKLTVAPKTSTQHHSHHDCSDIDPPINPNHYPSNPRETTTKPLPPRLSPRRNRPNQVTFHPPPSSSSLALSSSSPPWLFGIPQRTLHRPILAITHLSTARSRPPTSLFRHRRHSSPLYDPTRTHAPFCGVPPFEGISALHLRGIDEVPCGPLSLWGCSTCAATLYSTCDRGAYAWINTEVLNFPAAALHRGRGRPHQNPEAGDLGCRKSDIFDRPSCGCCIWVVKKHGNSKRKITMARAWVVVAAAAAASLFPGTQAQCTAVDASKTYDYIVIGTGAGGIPIADRLSEAGKSVLLVEKGPPSSGRWNGTMKPAWLQGTNLTRFDVPGLFNQIWADGNGVACEDTGVMAGW